MSYHQNFFSTRTKENQIYDMVETLLQRFSYLITDDEWRGELDEESICLLGRLADILRETAMDLDAPSYKKQIRIAEMHLEHMLVPEGRIRIFKPEHAAYADPDLKDPQREDNVACTPASGQLAGDLAAGADEIFPGIL